jgi:hypothetical protein
MRAVICFTPDARCDRQAGEEPQVIGRPNDSEERPIPMNPLPRESDTPLLWMLIFVPAVLIAAMSV